MEKKITMAYGNGGALYHELVSQVFLPAYGNAYLSGLGDSAICPFPGDTLAMTTDSFVVKPRFFPGGDLGRLAVCGTVNDLSVSGAKPLYLTVGMIIEDGLPIHELKQICASMAQAAAESGVKIVTGDTKVVEQGSCDGIFINTAGVGILNGKAEQIRKTTAEEGDLILISGAPAAHGMAVMAARHQLQFDPPIRSDVAPLHELAELAWETGGVCLMRDPTRGGVASVLNEWSDALGAELYLDESLMPCDKQIRSACDLLGIDPLYVANEGKLMLLVKREAGEAVLNALRSHGLGKNAAIIGVVGKKGKDGVYLKTEIGSSRPLGMIDGEQLPRIC